jgi:hypothetical protein
MIRMNSICLSASRLILQPQDLHDSIFSFSFRLCCSSRSLTSNPLHQIDFPNSLCSDALKMVLSAVASSLEALGLGSNRLCARNGVALDAVCGALRVMPHLAQLDLSSNGLRASAGVALAEAFLESGDNAEGNSSGDCLRNLRVLDLANNTIGKTGGVALAR